ncbi:MAG: chromosome segregation protein SMC [Archaeoglobales archaeon]|nr:chromosome segregation protein SMC [Archaeoglobales archaeon]
MFIERIVLRNFKSFGKKTEVPLYKGFTVITGPNGSGKSNIVDSILFCLGLSTSTKQLRADKLTDLIHNGRKDVEVSVIFNDNNNKIEITRKIKTTDKNYYSYYYLNGKPSSLAEIHKTLEKYGIYSEAYNIVMQGDVTRIIEMSPYQRRKIIEDIAGISEFDEKKEQALGELEKVKGDIEKIDAILSEIEKQLEVLRRDRDEALRYKNLLETRKELEYYLKAHRYLDLEGEKQKIENEIKKIELEKDATTAKLSQIISQASELAKELERITKEISNKGDIKILEINSRILELTSQLETIKKTNSIYLEEIKRFDSENLSLLAEISNIKGELEKTTSEIEENSIKRVQTSEILHEIEKKLDALREKIDAAEKENKELKENLINKKEKLEELKQQKLSKLREKDRLVETLRMLESEIDNLSLEIEKNNLKKYELEKRISELKGRLEELDTTYKNLQNKFSEVDKRLFSVRSSISDLEEELKNSEIELAKIRARLSTLQTFSKSVEAILEAKRRGDLLGIYGTVAQLGEVSQEHVNAIEAAAGSALQYIVVENEDVAVEAIKYLKAIKAGRASFLPLRRIKEYNLKLDKSILNEKGVIGYAVNLVNCEKTFRPVFEFILRDTLVVDTVDTARRLMDKGYRIVTLDGDLVERSGLMTGGSSERRNLLISKEILENERELENKVIELQRKREDLLKELNKLESIRKEYRNNLEDLKQKISDILKDIELEKQKMVENTERIEQIKVKILEKNKDREEKLKILKNIENEISQLDELIAAYKKDIEVVEKKLGKVEVSRLLFEADNLRSESIKYREILISIEKKLEALEFKKTQLEKSLNDRKKKLAENSGKVEEFKLKIDSNEKSKERIKKELERLREEEKGLHSEISKLREVRDSILSKMKGLEEEKASLEKEVEKLENKFILYREKLEKVITELKNFEGIVVPEKIPEREIIEKEYSNVLSELEKFGDVNLKAIQEYEDVWRRREELINKRSILEREREDIIRKINEYEQKKREVFYEVFNAVRRNFIEIIREITNGEGDIYLDSDDPFSSGLHIKVKPNNKPVQKLESMSGGEKSLVALALIFAIQMYRPAPFYAFDEVDMFLDGVNVGRVAKMIKKMSKEAQFIVISLRKPMLENADAIVGVTMGGDNSSIVTGIKLVT